MTILIITEVLGAHCKFENFNEGLLEPEFYGDLVYKLKKIVGSDNFKRSSLE